MRGYRWKSVAMGLTAGAIALAVTACGSPSPSPSKSPSPSPTSSTPTATPVEAPVLRPLLSADENKEFFDYVAAGVIAANSSAGGRDFIDALVAGGFDRTQMQVTPDRTAVDLAADSVQWSVLFQGECLIGQYGPASGGYHGVLVAPTGQGTCLVGETR
ncbi:MAG: hypothetical protein ABWY36_08375, partial [Leifsonia sp.]